MGKIACIYNRAGRMVDGSHSIPNFCTACSPVNRNQRIMMGDLALMIFSEKLSPRGSALVGLLYGTARQQKETLHQWPTNLDRTECPVGVPISEVALDGLSRVLNICCSRAIHGFLCDVTVVLVCEQQFSL
jgi:hypothetical protein